MTVTLKDPAGLIAELRSRIGMDSSWALALDRVEDINRPEQAHIAVMHEPYLSYVVKGRKTIESRFSRHRTAPYGQVARGDVILFKLVGGPVTSLAHVAEATFYELDPATWASIRDRFSAALCTDERFWEDRQRARYASLIRLATATSIDPLSIDKRDRRPWVVLAGPQVASAPVPLFHRDSDGARFVQQDSVFKPRIGKLGPSGKRTALPSAYQSQMRFPFPGS